MTYSDQNHIDNLETLVRRMARLMEFACINDIDLSSKSMRTMAGQARDYLSREGRGPSGPMSLLREKSAAPMTERKPD
jgi:hypothetical protein